MVGSGISGLFCALKLADAGHRVVIVTKNALTENNSRYAQGGIAAVLPDNDGDTLQAHLEDTLTAGAGLCEPERVEAILQAGHQAIADLLLLGVPFDRDELGELSLTLEGGHQAKRILHAGGDATGQQVELTLTRHVESHPNITVMAYCQVANLRKNDDVCIGANVVDTQTGENLRIDAGATILATGGAGQLFAQTTNPVGATGNGFVLAAQAGATLVDMAFIQFHPTGFIHQGQTKFLLSEALRGEGGVLRKADGQALMANIHPQADLAPRDVVARAIHQTLYVDNTGPVTLDMSHQSANYWATRFPNIAHACQQFGLTLGEDPIPVAPAAHYMMGGVAINDHGFTGVNGLYAIGETVWTGLHGANRLASNSLLECVVIARNTANYLAQHPCQPVSVTKETRSAAILFSPNCLAEFSKLMDDFRQQMTARAGIIRNHEGLIALQTWLTNAQTTFNANNWHTMAPWGVDGAQQLQLAQWIVHCALNRQESRGAHTRQDYPQTEESPRHQHLWLTGYEQEKSQATTQWQPVGSEKQLYALGAV